ncbi:MAG: serine/threonine protein kinase [Phycisphaerales bacterium]|nr:MAG: serine/threonine protein kinase [Phycisphaerales bacterium]
MDAADREQVEELFQQAADLPPERRVAFLNNACTDPRVREEVDSLLAHLESRRLASLQAVDSLDKGDAELIGEPIGPYTLLELIGEGGFGVVYVAQQERPVQRRVAVKIIKLGMDTKQVIARFEAERQALAMMEHPNIAKVLDAGATETGRPYFAMELVRGVSITEHCDENRSTTRQRLELFIQVCRAVHHAHQKGIIHRDIKPSNVLVTLHDGVPVPKIIDFGIAKAMYQSLTDKTLFTGFRQFVGTPEYVSPEQVEMSPGAPGDVDTRSDIYSLGVLLYELLTGMTPFDPRVFKDATYSEIQRIICEQDPITPSRRVGTVGAALRQVAIARQTEPHILGRLLRGDLDWIVMRALEKDRNRRYESAAAMADDIRRHLENEPVSAGPPGAIYRLRKMAARHKAAFGFTVTLIGVVIAFGIWMSLLFAEAERHRLRAERERNVAAANLIRAQEAEERARTEAHTASEVAQILAGLFEVADPLKAKGGGRTAREVLDAGAAKIRDQLQERPEAQAALMDTIGCVYTNLGIFDKAEPLLKEALELRRVYLGDAHPDTVSSMNNLGKSLMYDHRLSDAEALLRRAMEIGRSTLGEDHPETIASISSLSWTLQSGGRYAEAEPLCREALEAHRRAFGDEHPKTLVAINALSWLLQCRNNFEEAETLSREALQTGLRIFGEESLYTAESMNVLGVLLVVRDRLSEAEPFVLRALDVRRRFLGAEHVDTLESISNLAHLLLRQGRPADAEVQYRKALAGYERVDGKEHRRTFRCMSRLCGALIAQGKFGEAEPLLERALTGLRREPGERHRETLDCLDLRLQTLSEQGRLEEAEPVLRELLVDLRPTSDDPDIRTLRWAARIGHLLRSNRRSAEAAPLLEAAYPALRRALGDEHEETIGCVYNRFWVLLEQGKLSEAEAMMRESLPVMRKAYGDQHVHTARHLASLGVACRRQDKLAEAEQLLEKALPTLRRERGDGNVETLYYLDQWLRVLHKRNNVANGEAMLRESLSELRAKLGDEHPTTIRWMARLGLVLVRRGDLADAEYMLGHALPVLRRELGEQHWETLECFYQWLNVLLEQDKLGEHDNVIREVLARHRETFGEEAVQTSRSMIFLARALQQQGRLREAEAMLRDVLEIVQQETASIGCKACLIGIPQSLLGEYLAAQGHYEEAESLLLEGFATIESGHGKSHTTTPRALRRIVNLYDAWGKPDEASRWRARSPVENNQ